MCQRQGHETRCHELLSHARERLERLRCAVERGDGHGRAGLERALDTARGLLNRVHARIEAARQASDEAWPFARAQTEQAVTDLAEAIDDLERRLSKAAA